MVNRCSLYGCHSGKEETKSAVFKCSSCNKLNNIIYPFSLEAVECEHLLFC